jgi:FtsZ-interacting cell division protein ZipA
LLWFWIIVGVVAVVALLALAWWTSGRSKPEIDNPFYDAGPRESRSYGLDPFFGHGRHDGEGRGPHDGEG